MNKYGFFIKYELIGAIKNEKYNSKRQVPFGTTDRK